MLCKLYSRWTVRRWRRRTRRLLGSLCGGLWMIRGRASKGKDSERLEVAIAGRRVPVLCTSLLSYSAYNAWLDLVSFLPAL